MRAATLILPHQLFSDHPALSKGRPVHLLEERSFFHDRNRGIRSHIQKIILHKVTVAAYGKNLVKRGFQVHHWPSETSEATLEYLLERLSKSGIEELYAAHPEDMELEKRFRACSKKYGIRLLLLESPNFLATRTWIKDFFGTSDHLSQTSFYIAQRKRLKILVDEDKPRGGRWSFDPLNRKRLPKGLQPPVPNLPLPAPPLVKVMRGLRSVYREHPGSAEEFAYPTDHRQAERWLGDFLENRLSRFGDYEDAMRAEDPYIFHSVLTPALNIGLLTPNQIVERTLDFARADSVPLNALEGFLRQIIGWREFMRAAYILHGRKERTCNFWSHNRELPASLYSGETGLLPVDIVVRRVWNLAYAHHIERLMVLGNFCLLCEINPDDVYRWFMEMFIDAYDWVMVPNVYGMSQYADGGLITTKPYISSSRYILRMSDFPKGDWCSVWDDLYWRFIAKHRDFFASNPRLRVMTFQLDRMGKAAVRKHIRSADQFLSGLDQPV